LDVKHFIKHSGVKSALSTIILIIPLLLGIWADVDVRISIFLVAFTAILNAFFVYYDYKQPSWDINEMLEFMVKTIWGSDQASRFRSNVMLYEPKSKKLQIKYSYNMMGHNDRFLSLNPEQGCAGKAFKDEKAFWVDLTTCAHENYLVDSTRVWNPMKSVMSVPIFKDEKVVGVLNIDSNMELPQVFMEEGKIDEKILNSATAYSDLVARWL
jgi:hypothetical protein